MDAPRTREDASASPRLDALFKLGGSLLDLPDLPQRLDGLRERYAGARSALLVGGGSAADAVRAYDERFGLGPERGHELAVRAMSFQARLVAAALGRAAVVEGPDALAETLRAGAWPVLEPIAWLEAEAALREGVPRAWAFTSDSIAARLAWRLRAGRLVLLKSRGLRGRASAAAAAADGLVDEFFPEEAARLARVEVLDLRSAEARPVALSATGEGV